MITSAIHFMVCHNLYVIHTHLIRVILVFFLHVERERALQGTPIQKNYPATHSTRNAEHLVILFRLSSSYVSLSRKWRRHSACVGGPVHDGVGVSSEGMTHEIEGVSHLSALLETPLLLSLLIKPSRKNENRCHGALLPPV